MIEYFIVSIGFPPVPYKPLYCSLLQALLEYEKHKVETGEFQVAASTLTERIASESQVQFYDL